MRALISEPGTGKNFLTSPFSCVDAIDKAYCLAYFGASTDIRLCRKMPEVSNNRIVLPSDARFLEGQDGIKIDKADFIARCNNSVAIEDDCVKPYTLFNDLSFLNDESLECFYVPEYELTFCTIKVKMDVEVTYIPLAMLSPNKMFSDFELFDAIPFIQYEGYCKIPVKTMTPRSVGVVLDDPQPLSSDEEKELRELCKEHNLPFPEKGKKITPVNKLTGVEGLDVTEKARILQLYSKQEAYVRGPTSVVAKDDTRVNISTDSFSWKDPILGVVSYSFNPVRRIVNCKSLVFIDSLSNLVWTEFKGAYTKNGLPTAIPNELFRSTFSGSMLLYAAGSFDVFGNDFSEMLGGSVEFSKDVTTGFIQHPVFCTSRWTGRKNAYEVLFERAIKGRKVYFALRDTPNNEGCLGLFIINKSNENLKLSYGIGEGQKEECEIQPDTYVALDLTQDIVDEIWVSVPKPDVGNAYKANAKVSFSLVGEQSTKVDYRAFDLQKATKYFSIAPAVEKEEIKN